MVAAVGLTEGAERMVPAVGLAEGAERMVAAVGLAEGNERVRIRAHESPDSSNLLISSTIDSIRFFLT